MQHARRMRIVVLALGLPAAAAMGTGCASKRTNLALDEVRTSYAQAQQSPEVTTHAPIALYEAEQALRHAEDAWEREKDTEQTNHLAYLTQRRIDVARAVAERRAAQAELEQMGDRRQSVLLQARETELAALKVTLGDVMFEFGKADLKPGGERSLAPTLRVLRDHPERRVRIEGHTDSVGSAAANRELSLRRAEAIKQYLVVQGVDPSRITTHGLGKSFPVASNATELGRQQNRRVELTILGAVDDRATAGRR